MDADEECIDGVAAWRGNWTRMGRKEIKSCCCWFADGPDGRRKPQPPGPPGERRCNAALDSLIRSLLQVL